MKIVYGDLLDQTTGFIMHGVNCQKKFASGVAGQIRKKFPHVYEEFMDNTPILGDIQVVNIYEDEINNQPLYIVNAYTQFKYGSDGKKYASVDAIKAALTDLIKVVIVSKQYFLYGPETSTIHMPKIGCGLGGLDWETEVKPAIEEIEKEYEDDSDSFQIIVYEFNK